jgi:DNA-binding NarL/FixJ family response regulator
MNDNKIRIILADDHVVLREALRSLLVREPDMEVVAEVSNGRDAVEKALAVRPDIVVMDIRMPDLNGIDATRQLVSGPCKAKVLCLSMHEERSMVFAMLEAGASGYLLKTSTKIELVKALRTVAAGEVYLSPAIAGVLVNHHVSGKADFGSGIYSKLTMREREVLQLIAEGHNTKIIADRLDISPKTVLAHRDRLMKKLGLDSTAALTLYALRQGITEL